MLVWDLYKSAAKTFGIGLTERQKLARKIKASRKHVNECRGYRNFALTGLKEAPQCPRKLSVPPESWEAKALAYWYTRIGEYKAAIMKLGPVRAQARRAKCRWTTQPQ